MAAKPQPSLGQNSVTLFLCAQKIAERTPGFFTTKGPGAGDRASLIFMADLRQLAKDLFSTDYSEKRVCPECDFRLDFYFPGEQTAVEIGLSLDKPISEYERDIFKCLLACEAGMKIAKLLLIGKPGARSRLRAPGPRGIANFVQGKFGLEIEVLELTPAVSTVNRHPNPQI